MQINVANLKLLEVICDLVFSLFKKVKINLKFEFANLQRTNSMICLSNVRWRWGCANMLPTHLKLIELYIIKINNSCVKNYFVFYKVITIFL